MYYQLLTSSLVTTTTFSFFFLKLSMWKIASVASCLCSSLKSTAIANKFGRACSI